MSWLKCHTHINSLVPEADKSTITGNAYQPYTCSTKIDISACLPAAFSSRYCNLRGNIKMYMIFCIVLFLLSWFLDRSVANRINFILITKFIFMRSNNMHARQKMGHYNDF